MEDKKEEMVEMMINKINEKVGMYGGEGAMQGKKRRGNKASNGLRIGSG